MKTSESHFVLPSACDLAIIDLLKVEVQRKHNVVGKVIINLIFNAGGSAAGTGGRTCLSLSTSLWVLE